MSVEREISLLLELVRDDCQEWLDLFSDQALRLMTRLGPAGAELMATTPDNQAKLHASYLLASSDRPEAAHALTVALDAGHDEEVLGQILEEATDSPPMRAHAPFVAKARELSGRWSNRSLDDSLLRLEAKA